MRTHNHTYENVRTGAQARKQQETNRTEQNINNLFINQRDTGRRTLATYFAQHMCVYVCMCAWMTVNECVPVPEELLCSRHSCVAVRFANKAKRSLLCMDGRDAHIGGLGFSHSAVRHSRTHSWRPLLFVVIDALFIYLATVSQRELKSIANDARQMKGVYGWQMNGEAKMFS